jgi:3-isopropylmalate/(R)-2-methylmalate dehydratase large subunit
MGMTMAQKILADHAIPERSEVVPGEYIWARIDETNAGGSKQTWDTLKRLGVTKLFDPDRIYVIDDHKAPPPDVGVAEQVALKRRFVKEFGITHWFEYGRHGILHQRFPEAGYVVPGDLIAMSDSHSTTYGAFNALSAPINAESIYVLVKGQLWFKVPETVKFWITGDLPELCVGKDVILKIAGEYGTDVALYKAVEYLGPTAAAMSLDSRWTMSNMGIEIGAKCAMFEADQKTFDFLDGRTDRPCRPVSPDADAQYGEEHTVDVSTLEPLVACPHDPGNVKPARDVERDAVRIDQGFIGSCTNGRFEDLQMAAAILKGNTVHPDVRLIVSPNSMEVYRNALKAGLLEVLVDAEAMVCHPTCGPCMGSHLGILAAGERCIATTNRNFKGRQGSPESEVYLANAATVAASAIAGTIVDPRGYA